MAGASAEHWLRRLVRVSENPVARAVLTVVIMAIAIYVLHDLSREVHPADVRADLRSAPVRALALAVLCTGTGFVALSLYDVIAARAIAPGVIPDRVAALAGATGYALSNLLGFSYLTGSAVRYRIYANYGLDMARVAALLAFSYSAFWCGLLFLIGCLLLLHPAGLASVLPISRGLESAVGAGLLVLLGALLAFLRFGPRKLPLAGTEIALPGPGAAMALTGVAFLDILAAGLTLYVLMPPDLANNLAFFFVVYIAAIGLGVLSHAPGGLGVFEATILGGLGAGGRSDALAALVLYRVIYTGLPFIVAATGLVAAALVARRGALGSAARRAHDVVQPFVPLLAAAVALLAGSVLLLSGALPAVGGRMAVLRDLVPLGVVEVSHLAGSVAGLLLLVLARGLYRRLYRAWVLSLVLLGIGFTASLAKGIDVEEAVLAALSAGLLWVFRGSFYRVDRSQPLRPGPGWVASVAVLFAGLTWIGFFAYKHVEYRDALWWHVSWSGDASRFLRASLVASVVLAAIALNAVIGARGRRHAAEPIPDVVRRLVSQSPQSEAGLALLGDKSFLLDPDGRAFLSYGDTGRALVGKGDPVGDPTAARDLLWRFREMADREGKRAVFYAVSPDFVPTFLDMGLAVVKFGEVGKVDLASFTLDIPGMKDFRYASKRATREGYRFEVVPASDVAALLPDLKRVSDAWLSGKQGREKGFALGFFDEDYLSNFDIAVLRAPGTGEIVAFANLLKGGTTELSVDLMRYAPEGPTFAMDALFAGLMLWGKAQGFGWFNLGAAPFAGSQTHALASPWQRLGGYIYEHGEDVYHFEGLRAFKEKFHPVWTPNYIACRHGVGVALAFMDANTLISGGLSGLMRKGAAE